MHYDDGERAPVSPRDHHRTEKGGVTLRFEDKNFRTNLATRLEVRYQDRKPSAAYLYLPCREGDLYRGSRPVDKGLVLDYSQSGRLLGIEITMPGSISPRDINDLLGQHGIGPLHDAVLNPLRAS